MSTQEKSKDVNVDEQKKMSPQERRISQRYGLNKQSGNDKRTTRSINDLYKHRYKKKFR